MNGRLELQNSLGLELTLRPADERDMSFCYELMCHNMKSLFDKNTKDGWSREKFRLGFDSSRITVVEDEKMSIGFYDLEIVEDELYCHNLQLSIDFQIGVGIKIIELLEKIAIESGAKSIVGKVFSENSRAMKLLQILGYNLDKNIEEENSYWIRKDLGESK